MIFKLLRDGSTAFCFLVLLALIAAKVDVGETYSAQGEFYVIDGDTISIDRQRLRLKGIDAPELEQKCERSGKHWSCGQRARAALTELLRDEVVRCEGNSKDKFGRRLVVCRAGERNLNAAMVRQGFALAYGEYEGEERDAERARRGVWAGNFVRPVEWRRTRNQGRRASLEPFFD